MAARRCARSVTSGCGSRPCCALLGIYKFLRLTTRFHSLIGATGRDNVEGPLMSLLPGQ